MTAPVVQMNVNLAALQGFAQRKLQRLVDIVEVTHAGLDALNEGSYPAPFAFVSIYPSNNTRLGLGDAKSAAEHWLALHCLRDAIEVVSLFLEHARRCCAVFQLARTSNVRFSDFQRINDESIAFHALGLPTKIRRLREEFGVQSDFTTHVLTLNETRNCVVHRHGIVSEIDTKGKNHLLVSWVGVRAEATSPDGTEIRVMDAPGEVDEGWSVAIVTEPTSKEFTLGSEVEFSYSELSGVLYTHFACINDLTASVHNYAASLGFVEPVPPSQ